VVIGVDDERVGSTWDPVREKIHFLRIEAVTERTLPYADNVFNGNSHHSHCQPQVISMSQSTPVNFENRDAIDGLNSLFVERWSPRAFQSYSIELPMLTRIMEAARWAPSCYNEQPWRFYTSTSENFDDFLGLLLEGNQRWAGEASVLGFLVGKKYFSHNQKENSSFQLDCGAAWMSMTFQARFEGLYTHGMAGIKHQEVAQYLGLDTKVEQVLMGFAIGKIGDSNTLPDNLQEKETPSDRQPLAQIWNPS